MLNKLWLLAAKPLFWRLSMVGLLLVAPAVASAQESSGQWVWCGADGCYGGNPYEADTSKGMDELWDALIIMGFQLLAIIALTRGWLSGGTFTWM
jgi:hypothetical protein